MSFSCAKSTLIVLNLFYVMVAFILIGVGTYGRTSNVITSLEIVGGIVASGVFLLFVSVAGLYGTIKHQQVTLFIYMIVLFAIFVIQFSVSCACLAVSKNNQIKIAQKAWDSASDDVKFNAESLFGCCGFLNSTDGYNCDQIKACHKQRDGSYDCQTCFSKIQGKIGHAFSLTGGVGLFFAFTEFFAILHAHRFRLENAHYVS